MPSLPESVFLVSKVHRQPCVHLVSKQSPPIALCLALFQDIGATSVDVSRWLALGPMAG